MQTRAGTRRQHHGDDHFGDKQVAERSTVGGAAAQGDLCNPDGRCDAGAESEVERQRARRPRLAPRSSPFQGRGAKARRHQVREAGDIKGDNGADGRTRGSARRIEEDGEPTSGTAKNAEEVYAREKYNESKQQAEDGQSTTGANDGGTAPARWGFVSDFCGLGSMSFAAEPLGGVPLAGFDMDETVQRLWTERTGIGCWGGFASVIDAACGGLLDWLRPLSLIYISGSPCPDYSRAGLGHGVSGRSGSLWIGDCHLGIRLQPPVSIREMVTGIFDTDGGVPF